MDGHDGTIHESYGPDLYTFTNGGALAEFSRIRSHQDTIKAEVELRWTKEPFDQLLWHGSLNLLADRTLTTVAKKASERVREKFDWVGFLTDVTYRTVHRFRAGDPLRPLDDYAHDGEQTKWLLRPLVENSGPTVIAAPGGSVKSFIGLACAASVAAGRSLLPNCTVMGQGPVVYLDWEASGQDHWNRMHGLYDGDLPVLYRREYAPLTETAEDLARELARAGVVMAVVDSKGAASGGPEEADTVLRFFNAIRRLQVPTLVIDHVTKAAARGDQTPTPFGSVYTWNMARQVWTARKADSVGDTVRVVFECVKSNNGRVHQRLAWQLGLHQRSDGRYERVDISEIDQTAVTAVGDTTGEKIRNTAEMFGTRKWTYKELAHETGCTLDSVKKALQRGVTGFTSAEQRGEWWYEAM